MLTGKKILSWLMLTASCFLVFGLSVLLWLVVIRTPSSSRTLSFDGFIELPRAGFLNVLDYVSIFDRTLYVTSERNGSVYSVLLNDGDPRKLPVKTFAGEGAAHGVVSMPANGVSFVTRSISNRVDVFDPGNAQVLRHIPVADDPDGLFNLQGLNLLYAASGDANLGTLIDPTLLVPVGSIALGGRPEFAIYDKQTQLIYQNLEDKNEIAVVDPKLRVVTARWPLRDCEAPTGMAMDEVSRKLFVLCSSNARLLVVDIATHAVVAAIGIGRGPDAVAYDPDLHRIYTAGSGGTLDVVEQNSSERYTRIDSVTTHFGAHTLGLDPISHKVYVAYAGLLTAPRLAVFSPR